ncbi:MAG: tyrosine-type recombinase/integrase [Terriglobales bacterium]
MTEQWRDVSGYDGIYQVSDQGHVRNTHTSKILQPVRIKNGRLYVSLSSDGFQRKCTVHSLVAAAFLGDCPPKHEITHKDGDYTNNAVENLEYVTRGENQKRFVMRSGGYSVNLTKRVQTPNGMRYCPVAQAANGRVKPDVVLVNGKEERHPEGAYYLEWRDGAKRVRLSVGKDPAEATARRLRKEGELNAVNNGVSVVPDGQNGHRSVAAAVAEFLDETKLTKKPKTLAAYSTALTYFVESCHKLNLEEIDRKDMLKFSAFLRDEKEQAPRSVYNKFENVMSFLKAQGIRGLVGKNDWPRYTEEEPEIYEQEELDKLFAKCDPEERLWYEFFLMTGEREQEVMYTYWSDVNFAASTVRVSHKPDVGWTPKAYKEREIPIPSKLVNRLKVWKAKSEKGCAFVFPTSGCKPKLNFLDDLKAVAERAKLDPDTCWLHKFRSTFATRNLWEGVDLRTVQLWLGHTDIESTMRYLKPSRSKGTNEKVNAVWE